MGEQARLKKDPSHRSEVIHRRQLFGGRFTAEDVYRASLAPHKCGEVVHANGVGSRLVGCGGAAHHHYRVFWPYKELVSRWPHLVAKVAATSPTGEFPTTLFRDGERYALVTNAYCCDDCEKGLAAALAKGPSWVCVDKAGEPGKDTPVVQMPGELTRRAHEKVEAGAIRVSPESGMAPSAKLVKAPSPIQRTGLVGPDGRGIDRG